MYQIKGRIDSNNAAEFEKELMTALPTELDASGLEYISSAGLRVLLKLTKAVGDVTVSDVSPEVYEILDVTGFTSILTVKKAEYQIMAYSALRILFVAFAVPGLLTDQELQGLKQFALGYCQHMEPICFD